MLLKAASTWKACRPCPRMSPVHGGCILAVLLKQPVFGGSILGRAPESCHYLGEAVWPWSPPGGLLVVSWWSAVSCCSCRGLWVVSWDLLVVSSRGAGRGCLGHPCCLCRRGHPDARLGSYHGMCWHDRNSTQLLVRHFMPRGPMPIRPNSAAALSLYIVIKCDGCRGYDVDGDGELNMRECAGQLR